MIKSLRKNIDFNYPITISIVLGALLVFCINKFIFPGFNIIFSSQNPIGFFCNFLGHINYSHLYNNILCLCFFGILVEKHYNRKALVTFILISTIIENLYINSLGLNALGASGIVSSFAILALANNNKNKISILLYIVVAQLVCNDIIAILKNINDGTAHNIHFIAYVLALMFIFVYRKCITFYKNFKKK